MATRYRLEITFGGEESEAPEDWQRGAIMEIASMIETGYTSGEISIYGDDQTFRGFWTLDAEDE